MCGIYGQWNIIYTLGKKGNSVTDTCLYDIILWQKDHIFQWYHFINAEWRLTAAGNDKRVMKGGRKLINGTKIDLERKITV